MPIRIRAELTCPVGLVVICVSGYVARWAASPIALGFAHNTVTPFVIGPETPALLEVPFDTPVSPEWALLRAVALSRTVHSLPAARAAIAALVGVDQTVGEYYYELLYNALKRTTRRELEAEMVQAFPRHSPLVRKFKSLGREEGRAEGRAEGRTEGLTKGLAAALRSVLEVRGITLTKRQDALVDACTDAPTLDRWIRTAASATSARAVFSGE